MAQGSGIFAYDPNNECLGQLDPKLGIRLQRLMAAGNRYEAAVIGIKPRGISVILRETYQHPSMRNVCSFPARANEENRVYVEENFSIYSPENDSYEEIGQAVDFRGNDDHDDEE